MVNEYFKSLLKEGYKNEISGRKESKNKKIHASDVFNLCPRQFCLCIEKDIPFHVTEYIGNSTALTFDIGRKIQDIVINRLIKTRKLIGQWFCQNCGNSYYGLRILSCPKCNNTVLEYKDINISLKIIEDIYIVGNIDIQVTNGQYIYTGEIKSISKEAFNSLTEPLIQHQYQLKTYLYLLSHKDATICNIKVSKMEELTKMEFIKEVGAIIYIPKENVKDPFEKIFEVKLDRKFSIEIASKFKKIKQYIKENKLPENEYCKTELSLLARNCHVRKICLNKE